MELKVASSTPLHWSRRHSAIPSSSKRLPTRLRSSPFLGTQSGKLHRSKSCELLDFSNSRKHNPLRRVSSATFDFFSNQDFSVDLALQFKISGEQEPLDEAPWTEMVSIERKANTFHLPLSLRIIKRKLQEKALREATYSSINTAFSSMVFMIQDLHSFVLYQDVQGKVNKDMHASFLWIFQRVFSQTPTLMLYVMILLANFTVHSVSSNLAIVVPPPHSDETFQSSAFSLLMESTLGGQMNGFNGFRPITFDKVFHLSTQRDSISGQEIRGEELSLWNSMVEEAYRMQDSPVDRDMRSGLVSPIIARIHLDDHANYIRTEVLYKIGLAHEPNNPLLLANYAQFVYLVAQDYDRAEKCFKKAIESDEVDAEAYSKYAIFQWKVRKDLWAAEENFLEAISADPTNSFYAANYANFLWQTGGEETCYPIESFEYPQEMA